MSNRPAPTPSIVSLPKNDTQLADELRTLIARLCAVMNEAEQRGIETAFNIARKDPTNAKSAYVVTNVTLTKKL